MEWIPEFAPGFDDQVCQGDCIEVVCEIERRISACLPFQADDSGRCLLGWDIWGPAELSKLLLQEWMEESCPRPFKAARHSKHPSKVTCLV